MSRIITLTTDFGTRDAYVGTMKGVILTIAPHVTIVDITHQIAPQNIQQGAFLFASAARYFAPDAIHVVVVDPGVGSSRRPIAIRVGGTVFIAPDNGVLTPAVQACAAAQPDAPVLAIHLDRPEYWLPDVGKTFHGRDIFAPCAAHLARGIPFESLGSPIEDWIHLAAAAPTHRADGSLVAHVQDIDGFGNVVIDVVDAFLQGADRSHTTVTLGGRTVRGVRGAYADVAPGELVALVGSSGYLEVALRNGNAARYLGIQTGDEVVIVP
jgi:S-adenosylmethionine hydrolase